ncbi:MAG: SPOR domain-containing protein [Pseudomonadota bacterium]
MTRVQGVLAVAAIWAAGVGSGVAQEAPTFPATLERDGLLAWLQRETDILPDRVIAVTPQAVTSVVSTFPAGAGQGPRLVIRAEALNAEAASRTGALSWHVSLNADCQSHRVRLGETTGYDSRNLLGERRQLREADTEWREPGAGTALDFAWRAACDAKFKGPFQGERVKLAQTDAPVSTAPAPVTTITPPPPRPAPAATAPVQARSEPRPAPAQPAAPRAGAFVAQVGAGGSDAEARGLLSGLAPALGGRATWVERAVVGGKTWYRAVVGDFADSAEASRFCGELKAAGRACFVRAGKPG